MNDRDKLNRIFDYLEAFEADLYTDSLNSNEATRPIVEAKKSVIDKIIDYIERETGEMVRTSEATIL